MSTRRAPCGILDATRVRAVSEDALRAEIVFWRELIKTSAEVQPPESVERMRQALALAESKLQGVRAARQDREAGSLADGFRAPGGIRGRTSG